MLRNLVLLALVLTACGAPAELATRDEIQPAPDRTRRAPEFETPTTTTITVPARPAITQRASRRRPTPRVSPPRAASAPITGGDIFDALARCESGMNPRANTGNGFYGAFQFALGTWHSLGYSGNPVDFDYGTQKAAAQRLVARSGWGQFPACSRKIGAR